MNVDFLEESRYPELVDLFTIGNIRCPTSAVYDIKSCIITAEDAKVAKKFFVKILRNLCVLSDLCGKLVIEINNICFGKQH